ncbi:hypothetical protein ACFVFS_37935 [Kitasatospora sp. NPDC057692]|uniref:hypothetical protein n=1 Tax=Kitasatospora sp. NPDC057692 TaxID=3346215 RepID=UPI0036B65E7C
MEWVITGLVLQILGAGVTAWGLRKTWREHRLAGETFLPRPLAEGSRLRRTGRRLVDRWTSRGAQVAQPVSATDAIAVADDVTVRKYDGVDTALPVESQVAWLNIQLLHLRAQVDSGTEQHQNALQAAVGELNEAADHQPES